MEMLGRGDVTEWIPDNLWSLRSGEISGMTPDFDASEPALSQAGRGEMIFWAGFCFLAV